MNALIRHSVEELSAYAPGEQPPVGGLIKLNTNENPYAPSPRVKATLDDISADDLRLYPDPLSTSLRQRLAEVYGVSPEHIIVGNGSDEILALSTRAFVENEETIGYCETTYSLYPVLAEIRDVRKRPIELGPDFEWQTPEHSDDALFFLANPCAPTGMLIDKTAVREFCERAQGVVIIDEAYCDFAEDNCLDLAREMENVLVTRTLSKSFSLAGLRLGFAIGAEVLINAMLKIKDSYNVNLLSQRIALAALSDLDHMRKNCARVCETREHVRWHLDELGFKVFPSQSNFLWVEPQMVNANEMFEGLRDQGILVRHFPGEKTESCLRITITTDDQMDALFEGIRRVTASR
jgi:histidinol-phosphate aminotransferase